MAGRFDGGGAVAVVTAEDLDADGDAVVERAVELRRRGHRLVVHGEGADDSALAPLAVLVLPGDADPSTTDVADRLGLDPDRVRVVDLGAPGAGEALADHEPAAADADTGLRLTHGWSFSRTGHEPADVVTQGTAFLTGNGRLGYRGTAAEWGEDGFVACVVADTYDTADGKWRELVNAPNGLYAAWSVDGVPLGPAADEPQPDDVEVSHRFDLRLGRARRELVRTTAAGKVRLVESRFASMARQHLVVQRHELHAAPGTVLGLRTGVDGEVWQLNGEHLPSLSFERRDEVLVAHGPSAQSRVLVASAQAWQLDGGEVTPGDDVVEDRRRLRDVEVEVGPTGRVVLDLVLAVGSSNDDDLGDDVVGALVEQATRAVADGHATLLVEQVAAWDEVWDRSDVRLDGEPLAQVALRFGIHHNVVATPWHTDHLPIGARGLSCQAYQGAAFWDQEAFNLPMFTWTWPAVARRLLTYRVNTLDGARRKARRLGYRGAYFAWISGDTGDELCPDFFFRDVLTGRWIRNHFNDWQMHVSPDIVVAVRDYVAVTGDEGFLAEGGAELVFEVARFLTSFVLRDEDGHDHLVRLLGPDEFHENVDDNAFSNHQSEAALRFALDVHEHLASEDPDALEAVRAAIALDDAEVDRWRDVAERLVLPAPDEDGVIEAFDGFHDLEDVRPADLVQRLQDPDEYWGWPNGVAVHTQVSKQADVVQLFVAQPSRFDHDVMAANVDHYLPRTSHKSSLSRSAYAIVCARLGRTDQARELFVASAAVDLVAEGDHAPGGTFIGGLRTAAAGVSWSVAVLGFGGARVDDGVLLLAPRLPAVWSRLGFTVDLRGAPVEVQVTADEVVVRLHDDADGPREVQVDDTSSSIAPGEVHRVARVGGAS